MNELIWKIIFMLFWIGFCFIRLPHTKRYVKRKKIASRTLGEKSLVFLVGFGIMALPLIYVFTGWLGRFNMNLPEWSRWLGVISIALSLILLWWVHEVLGKNWSPVLEIRKQHKLITRGPYKYVRHPMYTFFWIWLIAQWLILSNWLVGIVGVAPWAVLYFIRVKAEETMMIERFGEKYKNYMEKTGRLMFKL